MAEQASEDVKDMGTADAVPDVESSTTENHLEDDDLGFGAEDEATSTDENSQEEAKENDASEPEPTESQGKNAETRKQQLSNEIRDKVAERNALRDEIKRLTEEKYKLKTEVPSVDHLMEEVNPETGEYYTRLEAKIASLEAANAADKERQALDRYTEQIVDNQMRIRSDGERVLRDFPIFDETSSEYNPELAKEADEILAGALMRDENTGQIIGCSVPIYTLYATIAKAARTAEIKGEVNGRKSTYKMLGSVDIPGSNVETKKSTPDEFLEGLLGD